VSEPGRSGDSVCGLADTVTCSIGCRHAVDTATHLGPGLTHDEHSGQWARTARHQRL